MSEKKKKFFKVILQQFNHMSSYSFVCSSVFVWILYMLWNLSVSAFDPENAISFSHQKSGNSFISSLAFVTES